MNMYVNKRSQFQEVEMRSRKKPRTLKYKDENKSDTSNDKGNWNHVKIIQKMPEQHTVKAWYQGTTENSRIWHCTQMLCKRTKQSTREIALYVPQIVIIE
jgi:hypothetical protein